MRSLRPIWRTWRLFILKWALKEINPMHPDLPLIVRRLRELEDSK